MLRKSSLENVFDTKDVQNQNVLDAKYVENRYCEGKGVQ